MRAAKYSALFEAQRRAGASFTELDGWQVPAVYDSPEREAACVRSSVGTADVSWMVKLDLKGFGMKRSPSLGERAFYWALGPLHYLATCAPPARDDTLGQLKAFQTAGVDPSLPPQIYITDVTSVYTQLLLAGPRSREVLRKLSSLNVSESSLSNLGCAQASVAHVRCLILRQDLGSIPAFHLLVSREYGESIWEAVLHEGHEFELAPFGYEAQKLLSI
jgi:glycine cleavage system aminomethyltransferase T